MLAQTLVLGKISFSVLSFWYYHILFYTKCDYQIKNSKFQEFLVFWFLSFVFLTNWMSRFQESNSLIRNSQFLNFSYLGILEIAMNVGFSQNGFSANKIPSFQIPSFVIPTKTFLVLSFPVSCVNRSKIGCYVTVYRRGTDVFKFLFKIDPLDNHFNCFYNRMAKI